MGEPEDRPDWNYVWGCDEYLQDGGPWQFFATKELAEAVRTEHIRRERAAQQAALDEWWAQKAKKAPPYPLLEHRKYLERQLAEPARAERLDIDSHVLFTTLEEYIAYQWGTDEE